jgi:PKD domain/Ig-like domain CHU_C associated
LLFSHLIYGFGQGPCPDANCNSGDIRITKIELLQLDGSQLPSSCAAGTSLQIKLRVTFDVTSATRYGFVVVSSIYINNSLAGTIASCDPSTFSQGIHTMDVAQYVNGNPIMLACGSMIQLKDTYTAWDQQVATASHPGICTYLNSNGSISDCSTIAPKCKFYGENEPIIVVAPLVASFTAQEGACNGLKRTWTFTSTSVGGTAPYTYTWNFGDGTPALVTTQNPVTHDYAYGVSGNVNVTLSVEDAATPTHNISAALPQTISVTSCCTASTVPTGAIAATPAICSGGNTNISVTGGSLGTGASWKWYVGGCGTGASIGTGTTINVNPTVTTTYYVRAEGDCGTTLCASVTVTVKNPSVAPTGASAVSPTVCSGQGTDISVTGGSLGTNAVWKWYAGGCASGASIGTGATITVNPTTTTTYYVRAEGDCNNTTCAQVTVTVKTLSTAPTGASAISSPICLGGNTNIGVIGGSLGTGASWKWYAGGCASGASIGTGATINVNPATTTTYFVRAEGDCNNTTCASVQVVVNPTSVGGTLAESKTICSGSNSGLLSLTGSVGSIQRFEFSTTSAVAGFSAISNTAGLSSYTSGALTQDTWFRVVVKSGVCSEAMSNAIKITVQQPIGNNTIAASQTICSGNTPAGLTGSTPTGGDGTYSYQWQIKTTGGFSNISGATDKDYAPGALSQTTQFKRIVTAGSACSNSASAAITITISPESQVYAISGSNFCASAPNTGTVKLMSSYPGVSYQLKKLSDNSDVQNPQIGTGAALTWKDLPAGSYYVYGTGLAPTYCISQTATINVVMFDCSVFYTLTQGYYGGKNGKSCIGSNPVNTIKYLLGSVDLVTGSTNSVTVPATNDGAIKLNQTMPGGNTPNPLPTGNCIITTGCFVSPTYLTQQGRINNVLLSQTITLGLNVRWNNGELLLFPIKSGYLTTQKMKGCIPNAVLVETCESGTISSILMNQNVVDYLGANATVADLLQLANDVLGGSKIPGVNGVPSYSNVNDAVDCINQSFDEGRRFLNYFGTKQTCEILFPSPALPTSATTTTLVSAYREPADAITVSAYPNPFADNINFQIETKQSGQGTLEVYNMTGQKIKTVFSGYMNAGRQRFSMNVPAGQTSALFYVFRMGSQRVSGKLLHQSR